MNEEQIERVLELIENAGGSTWEAVRRQLMVIAVWDVIALAALVGVGLVLVKLGRHFAKKPISPNHVIGGFDGFDKGMSLGLIGLGGVIVIGLTIAVGYDLTTIILNPEWAAIKRLGGLVTS